MRLVIKALERMGRKTPPLRAYTLLYFCKSLAVRAMRRGCTSLGQAPGYWAGKEWHLHPRPQNEAHCPAALQRFLSFPDSCDPKSRLKKGPCLDIDHAKVARLQNTSVLMIGDSTTTKMFDEVCGLFGASAKSFIDIPQGLDRGKYHHKLRSMDHHACHLLPDGLTLGGFAHYGATGPPYWSFAYPLVPWLAPTTRGQIRHDMLHRVCCTCWLGIAIRPWPCLSVLGAHYQPTHPVVYLLPRPKFRAKVGGDPTLIVATSGYWDISAWWKHTGNFSREYQAGVPEMKQYVGAVAEMIRLIRVEFPTR